MSRRSSSKALKIQLHADIFAALGDAVRLTLVSKLVDEGAQSISQLTDGTKITRQAVTKHLHILENVGVVQSEKSGRESIYELKTEPLESLQEYLKVIAAQWDQDLQNLKAFVES